MAAAAQLAEGEAVCYFSADPTGRHVAVAGYVLALPTHGQAVVAVPPAAAPHARQAGYIQQLQWIHEALSNDSQ